MSSNADRANESATPTILQRIATRDETAAGDCLDCYGNLIWSLAKKHTRSAIEAENAVCEIFEDIWKNAANFDAQKCGEQKFIALIALRRLFKSDQGAEFII